MHPLTANTIKILRELIAFDSVSRNSNLPIIDYLEEYMMRHGAICERILSKDGMKSNLLCRLGPKTAGGMVWSGHTDVVPIDQQVWDSDPFALTEHNGKLFGRGTADMKSFIACCLALLPELAKPTRTTPIYFAFSYDEEVGCLGAPDMVKNLITQGATPQMVIIGEPTLMQVVTAHKGVFSYETTVHGLEWHSSQPHLGVNAVQVACELVSFLSGMARELAAHGLQDLRFDPPTTTVHVGTIQGGSARNIIAGQCSFQWEIRPLPAYDADKLFERFSWKCDQLREDMKKVSASADIITRPMSRMAGVTLPQHAEAICTKVMHAATSNQQRAVSFGTEAGVFDAHGIPAIICGPGNIQQAHKPNEFIEISEISKCLSFLESLSHIIS